MSKFRNNNLPVFIFNKRRKHPSYVFAKTKDGKYKNILISTKPTSEKKKAKRNVALYKHPNPNYRGKGYLLKRVRKDYSRDFSKRRYSVWKFHKNDKRKVKKLIKKNKS